MWHWYEYLINSIRQVGIQTSLPVAVILPFQDLISKAPVLLEKLHSSVWYIFVELLRYSISDCTEYLVFLYFYSFRKKSGLNSSDMAFFQIYFCLPLPDVSGRQYDKSRRLIILCMKTCKNIEQDSLYGLQYKILGKKLCMNRAN